MSEGGGAAADSYIGSLISLTSKSEIRYEGVLYTVDTAESNIALQDVRSFGTEGRKKDGPQVPPSDKVYDYIIFRGSDIKDLQVKMSPPIRSTQPQSLHHDPAIISLQSQPSPMGPLPTVSSSTSPAITNPPNAKATETPTDTASYTTIPSVFRSNVPPFYQPQGSWAMPQVPQANMYWAGYSRPQVGMPFFQQQSQLPFQAVPLMPLSYASQSQFLQPQNPTMATSLSPSTSTYPSTLQAKSVDLFLNANDTTTTSTSASTSSKTGISIPQKKVAQTMIIANDSVVAHPELTKTLSNEASVVKNSTSLKSSIETKVLSNTVIEASVTQNSTGVESLNVVTVGTQPASLSASLSADPALTSQEHSPAKEPLLPLPTNPNRQRQTTQVYGSSAYARRGRGRGRFGGMSMFTEDFDFMAMNEKFNKDEVWGELGRSGSRDKRDGEKDASGLHYHDAEEDSYRTPVYVKDDFFDTLSSDCGGQNEKMKYSEQRKVDSETFGSGSVRSYGGRSNGYNHRGGDHRGRGHHGNRGRGRNYARRSPSLYY